jgi:WD40 repeat protein
MDELSSIMSSGKTQKKLSQLQESIIDILTAPLKGAYLYTITNKGKLLSFNIAQKKFAIIDSNIIDGWTSFVPNYLKNIEGSLLLNTLEGLFIITGANHNNLYFYSQEKNLIAEIISFKSGHKYGGLLLSPSPDNNLFAIGGENENNEVELLSFENDQCKNLPNLMTRRINASYTFINSKLYAIFGEGNNTIEYLNIKKLKNKWTKIDYKMDKNHKGYINNIYGHVSLPVDNDILIVGGKNNKKMMVLDLDEKTLDVTDMKVPFIDVVGEYLFDKEKFFNQTCNEEKKDQDGKNIKQLIGMDTSGNVHLFDYNFNYVVLLIKNHVKEK